MPFTFKLAQRLARMRQQGVGLTAVALAIAAVVSCELPTRPPVGENAYRLEVSPKTLTLQQFQAVDFTAVGLTSVGDTATMEVSWSVSSGSIVDTSTSSGRHRGRYRAGSDTGKVKVVAKGRPSGPADTAVVTVTPATVVSVAVSPPTAGVTVGQTVQLTATPSDVDGNALSGRVVTWASTNPGVATVNGSGLVSGVAAGAATVTAACEGQSGTAALTVTVVPVASIAVSPATANVTAGQTVQLTATPKDANGNPLTGRTVTWGTSNAAVAAVSGSGLVTGGAAGSATITASSEGKNGTAALTVTPVPVASVTVSPAAPSVLMGQTVQLTATPKDANGNTLTGRVVTWATSNAGVATVSGSGLVTSVAAGTATLTATSEGKSGTAALTVSTVPVATVTVTPASPSIRVGGTAQLTATPKDSAGNVLIGRAVTWTTSAAGVATVSASGLVSGVGAGSATITATSEGKSGTAAVSVTLAPVATVTVSPAAPSLVIGGAVQLTATTKDSAGNVLSGRVVTWTTSAAGVATVSASGLVSGVAVGSATITAMSEGKSGTATVAVNAVPVATVTVSPASASIRVGATAQLNATTKDSAGGVLTGRTITWSTSAAGVATVSASGLVTGVAAGSATITATSEGKNGTSAITVTVVPVASVTIAPASVSLFVSKTAQLTATTKDSAGNVLTGRAISWVSSNTAVATVSAAGLITAKVAGSATITATSEGKSGTAAITVLNVPVATVTVSPASASIGVGGSVQLAATTKDSAGGTLTGRVISWTSSSTAVATVNGTGLVTGLLAGTATITATSEGKTGSAVVTVTTGGGTIHAGFYVTTSGTSGNDGSIGKPWDLRTALSGAGGRIRPGDTVWVRGGTYVGTFTGSLTGTSAAPIVMRAYPGERAILDGNGSALEGFTVDGSWAIYWGLEVMNSSTARVGDVLGLRPTGVYVRNANNVKLINLIVHDTGHGTYTEYSAQNIEIYGWIIFNGGHQTSSRSDGHGIYIKNNTPGIKVARDNIIFNQFGFGIHGYSEGSGTLKNLTFEGNVLFNNGELSNDDNPNIQIGGNLVADNDVVADNMMYFSPGHGFWNIRIGYNSLLNGTTVVRNNYIVGGGEMAEVGYWQNLSWIGNTFVGDATMVRLNDPSAAGQTWSGNIHYRDPAARAWLFKGTSSTFAGWQQATGLAATDQAFAGKPTAPQVFVRPNQYEPGRATVVIYNWSRQGSVSVDLSAVVPAGWLYEIRNVQQIFGAPVASGTYGGGALSFPMGGVTAQAPIGGSPNAPLVTGPDFNVFVVTSRAP
jgi:uncharacterized protein YjdB